LIPQIDPVDSPREAYDLDRLDEVRRRLGTHRHTANRVCTSPFPSTSHRGEGPAQPNIEGSRHQLGDGSGIFPGCPAAVGECGKALSAITTGYTFGSSLGRKLSVRIRTRATRSFVAAKPCTRRGQPTRSSQE